MKTSRYIFALLFFTCSATAQITLDATYDNAGVIFPVCFSTGEKYVVMNHSTSPDTITIYNLDHALFKMIVVPTQGDGWNLLYIADALFDTDSTTIDYAISGQTANIGYCNIYHDDGSLIFSKDSVYGYIYGSNEGEGVSVDFTIQNDSGYFFPLHKKFSTKLFMYKLPGKVHHCGSCCEQGVFLGSSSSENKEMMLLGDPVPNPSNNSTTISYQLPSGYSYAELVLYNLEGIEIRRYKVGSAFHDIKISASDLVLGTYLYNLQTPDGKSDAKKMIVIR